MERFETTFNTPLGKMVAIADHQTLYLLEFSPNKKLGKKRALFSNTQKIPSSTLPLFSLLEEELSAYFSGALTRFSVPIAFLGTPFQQRVWKALCTVPYATTRSYHQLAHMINQPTASRAVAQANGANRIAILIPCHRIVRSDGSIGGYAAGIERKQQLLEIENCST